MFVPTKEELRERDRQRQLRRRQEAEAAAAQRRRQQRRRPLPQFADLSVKFHWLNGRESRLRAQLVLELFVRHFTAMAERLLEHDALGPALEYADHALNLCQLLEEHAGSEEADQARRQLHELRARAAPASAPLLPPETERPADADLLGLGAAADSAPTANWTLGPAAGRGVRRDYNLEETVGGDAEWQRPAPSAAAQQAAEVVISAC